MLGAIIGDIAGSRFEFDPTNDSNFEIFAPSSDFTDDTICTVAVMDAILHDRDFGECIHAWCRRYPDPMGGYGGRFAQWVWSDNPKPYGSYGNGAAMRVSPVAWASNNFEFKNLLDLAEKTAACTHNHPEGIKGAQTVALAIQYGIELPCYHPDFTQEHIKKLVERCAKFGGYNINIRKEDVENRFDETCQGTVPVALWIISESTSFEDAIRKAVSLGADADTLGAIVGSIAEAIWGIPEDMMMDALDYLPNEMKTVVLRFYSRFVRDSILRGYGDEGAARDLMLEEELREMQQKTADNDEMKEFQAVMFWKLGLGHMGKYFNGEDPMPDKSVMTFPTSWKIETMPETDISKLQVHITVSLKDMRILRKGHRSEAQEDHWFMYCTEDYIRYYRSWTGMCAFEAHYYMNEDGQFVIDKLTVNQDLAQFGVNGDEPALYLFMYLLVAEAGGPAQDAWQMYLAKWEKNYHKQRSVPSETEDKEKKERKNSPLKQEKKKQPHDTWYAGVEGHVCEGCIYTKGIRRWDDDPEKGIMGCGRLGYNSFRRNYTGGVCEYRKKDLYIPSEYEQKRKEEALRKRKEEEEQKLREYKRKKRLEKLEKEDGSYDRQLVKDFISEKLDGDVSRIAFFDYESLKDDSRFGNCKGYSFCVEKCDIVQAIQSVAFGEIWPGLTMDKIEDYTYTCNLINYSQYLFGANILDRYFKGMDKFRPTKEQFERAIRVWHLQNQIGNIWILPNGIDVDKDTYVYHGYADRWLKAVYDVMTGDRDANGAMKGILYKVRKQMAGYKGAEGFQQMAHGLMLDDYLDENGKPKQVLPYVWSMMKGLSKEKYFKAVDDYCSFMETFIPKRSRMIAERVRDVLSQDNMVQKRHIQQMLEEEDNNEYSKVGYRYFKMLQKLAKKKQNTDNSELFDVLNCMSLDEGYALGLKLAKHEGMGDESWFYIHQTDHSKETLDIPSPTGYEGDLGFSHMFVERNKMGAWQMYLFSIASTVLPVFWHGGYIRRDYIFKHEDLKDVISAHNGGLAPLYGIKDRISPMVKIYGGEATVQCCYWNDWEGLVRETTVVKFTENTVFCVEHKQSEVLFEYDCGICF